VTGGRLRGVLADTAPLRLDRDYRWLWTGQAINGIGTQITRIALPYQVYVMTGSTLAVAALTLAQLIPILIFALGAGSVADAVDRRKLLFATQLGLLACSSALLALSLQPAPPLIALYVVAFASAGLSAVDQPARSSSVPRLVPPQRLPAAIALNQLNFQVGSVVGPAIGGILIATVGLPGAYFADVLSFIASLIGVAAIAPLPPLGVVTRPGLAAIREGLRFVGARRVILSTFVIDLNAMIFGMPTSLFPALALDVFKVGPGGLGLLAAAPAVGAFLGALLSGWVSAVRRVGLAVIVAVVIWGVAIALFGLSTFSFPLALVFLAIAGAADVLSAVFRSTIVQLETPDTLRGRVTSIHILVVTSGPRLGDIEAATVAAFIGPQLSVVSGGLLCVAGVAVVARVFPELAAHVVRLVPGRAAP
jgi:MFS family permease